MSVTFILWYKDVTCSWPLNFFFYVLNLFFEVVKVKQYNRYGMLQLHRQAYKDDSVHNIFYDNSTLPGLLWEVSTCTWVSFVKEHEITSVSGRWIKEQPQLWYAAEKITNFFLKQKLFIGNLRMTQQNGTQRISIQQVFQYRS